MGCNSSKHGLSHVDDSVHVMIKHDKKLSQKHGVPLQGYKERAAHPLLKPKTVPAAEGAAASGAPKSNGGPVATEE